MLRRALVVINMDGITRKKTVFGFKSFLRWKAGSGERVYWEDLNESTQNFLYHHKIYISSRGNKGKFKKSCFWFLNLFPRKIEDEWELLFASDDIDRKLVDKLSRLHPDRNSGKVREDFYITLEIRESFKRRKKNMVKYMIDSKPEYIPVLTS